MLRPKFNLAESPCIEPGLLAVFRLAIILQIAVLLVRIGIDTMLDQGIRWVSFSLISLGGLVLLLGYLSWPPLWRALGRLYLPVALSIAAVFPLLAHALFIYFRIKQTATQLTDQDMLDLNWRLYIVLLVPIVLMAWQYTFRWVLGFSLGLILLSQVLAFLLFGRQIFQQRDLIELSLRGAMTFLIIGYLITRMMREQRDQRQALIAANTQLVDHATTAEQLAISRERNRLARDLHDTLAHTLSAVSIQLEAVDSAWDYAPDQARPMLIKSLGTARSGLAETRRALQALRSAPLDDLGLVLAVRALAESTAARTGAQLEIDIADEVKLSPEVEQTVYRVAQEALANITKHANARMIKLTLGKLTVGPLPLGRRDEVIALVVTDDGVGFETGKPAKAEQYGLLGMYERALLVGAQLQIESQPQRGTTVRFIASNIPTSAKQ